MKFQRLWSLLFISAAVVMPAGATGLSQQCATVNEQALKMVEDQQLLSAEAKLSEFSQNIDADSADGKICAGVTFGNLSSIFEGWGRLIRPSRQPPAQ